MSNNTYAKGTAKVAACVTIEAMTDEHLVEARCSKYLECESGCHVNMCLYKHIVIME